LLHPIISRTSFGPSAFAFHPGQLGELSPVPTRPLVYYPRSHPALGQWDANWNPRHGVEFNGATSIRGVVFPHGTRSLLFIGTQGIGHFCYGEGTDDPRLDGKPTPDGSVYCYDPDDASKGTDAYPYVPEVWAYDARDLAAPRQGHLRPWQVKPYATWRLNLLYGSGPVVAPPTTPATA
jgi:hypothetical protein